MKKPTTVKLGLHELATAPDGTIGVVILTEYVETRTLGGFACGAPITRCFAVFPSQQLRVRVETILPDFLQPKREITLLQPGKHIRVRVERPLGSIGSYVFTNKSGRLYVRPAFLPWSRRHLELSRTEECDIKSLLA
jgi:hypothetical protein